MEFILLRNMNTGNLVLQTSRIISVEKYGASASKIRILDEKGRGRIYKVWESPKEIYEMIQKTK